MPEVFLHIQGPLNSDPDLKPGDVLTLERSDGRPVWRQRLRMVKTIDPFYSGDITYVMVPAEITE